MSNTSMKRAMGFSMVVLTCLPLSTDCSSEWEAKWGRQLFWLSSTLSLICIMMHQKCFYSIGLGSTIASLSIACDLPHADEADRP